MRYIRTAIYLCMNKELENLLIKTAKSYGLDDSMMKITKPSPEFKHFIKRYAETRFGLVDENEQQLVIKKFIEVGGINNSSEVLDAVCREVRGMFDA